VFGNGREKKNAEFHTETCTIMGLTWKRKFVYVTWKKVRFVAVSSTYRRAENNDVRAPNALVVILNFM
jgi:hypothetical protein